MLLAEVLAVHVVSRRNSTPFHFTLPLTRLAGRSSSLDYNQVSIEALLATTSSSENLLLGHLQLLIAVKTTAIKSIVTRTLLARIISQIVRHHAAFVTPTASCPLEMMRI